MPSKGLTNTPESIPTSFLFLSEESTATTSLSPIFAAVPTVLPSVEITTPHVIDAIQDGDGEGDDISDIEKEHGQTVLQMKEASGPKRVHHEEEGNEDDGDERKSAGEDDAQDRKKSAGINRGSAAPGGRRRHESKSVRHRRHIHRKRFSKGDDEKSDVHSVARKADLPDHDREAHLFASPPVTGANLLPVPEPMDHILDDSKGQHEEDNTTSDPDLAELQSVIEQIADDHTAAMEEIMSQIVGGLVLSDGIAPYEDVVENFAVSKLELESQYEGVDQQLRLLRASGPKGVSRVSILTSVLNTLLTPVVLQTRADIRNLLIWLCSPGSVAHIDSRDANGDDAEARKMFEADVKSLIHPDGSIDLQSIWDPRVGKLALDCFNSHWREFTGEFMRLVWKRLDQGKEFLVGELRGLIGLPKLTAPLKTTIQGQKQHQPSESDDQNGVGGENEGLGVNVVTESNQYHAEDEKKDSKEWSQGMSPKATEGPRGLSFIQRNEDTSNAFASWFVESVVGGLKDHLDSGSSSPSEDTSNDILARLAGDKMEKTVGPLRLQEGSGDYGSTTDQGKLACARMKEKVSRALLG
ncbi:hypothetical protein BGZ58_001840 [Dissophora ornata]|nr:hypothetical protein BGZ58_001840 [Dissophora ornata]